MAQFRLLFLFLFLALGISCSASNKASVAEQVADVYINDTFRGTTPGTIRVYRGRKELSVSLKQGSTTVRSFAIEEHYSQNTAEVIFSVNDAGADGTRTYNVEELPSRDKLNYIIPFFERRLTVEDNQFGLTIIVVD